MRILIILLFISSVCFGQKEKNGRYEFKAAVTMDTLTANIVETPSTEHYFYYTWELSQDAVNGWDIAASGTGATAAPLSSTPVSITTGWMYGASLATGTTTTGRCYIRKTNSNGGGVYTFNMNTAYRYNFGTTVSLEDLSDGTETFGVIAGFAQDDRYANITQGCYFRYTSTDSSGTWIAVSEQNNSKVEDATDITVAADTDYKLTISVYGGNAYFYINNTLKATIAYSSSLATGVHIGILKSAGTTERTLYVENVSIGKMSQ